METLEFSDALVFPLHLSLSLTALGLIRAPQSVSLPKFIERENSQRMGEDPGHELAVVARQSPARRLHHNPFRRARSDAPHLLVHGSDANAYQSENRRLCDNWFLVF